MKTTAWRPPLKCRWFGHNFVETGYVLMSFMLLSPVERCTKYGGGRLFVMLLGFQYYEPKAIVDFIALREGLKSDNVVSIARRNEKA